MEAPKQTPVPGFALVGIMIAVIAILVFVLVR